MSRSHAKARNSRSAAVDLWDQMLDPMRNNEWSTFDDPEYEGWTEKELVDRI